MQVFLRGKELERSETQNTVGLVGEEVDRVMTIPCIRQEQSDRIIC